MKLPVVAVVGRPNVGKSTLVNRFVGRRDAIVEEKPGVTRDRKEFEAEWNGRPFVVVDTGGWLAPTSGEGSAPLARQVSAQAERALVDADVVLFVVDGTVGITEEDERVARVLYKSQKPVLVVVNKVDDERREDDVWSFASLGLGDPYPVSAMHGRASGELLDAVVAALPEEVSPPGADDAIFSVAIVGRPNVGKSTLFNRLVGNDRAIVHDAPGTTRDSIDTIVETEDGPLRFVDTAGMRRRSRIDEPTEYFSMVRALESVDRADAALLVIDASDGVTHQDQRLAERVDAAGTAVVVVLNKWDLLDAEGRARCTRGRCRSPRVPLVRAGAHGVRAYRPHDEPDPPCAPPGRGGVPPANPDRRAQPHRPRRAARAPGAANGSSPAACPLRDAGRDRPADLHDLRHAPAPADLPALPRAQDPRGVRSRPDPHEAARASPERLNPGIPAGSPILGSRPRRRAAENCPSARRTQGRVGPRGRAG